MPKPFGEDDDLFGDEDRLDDNLVEKPSVDLDDDDDDDDDAVDGDGKKKTRAQKKAERPAMMEALETSRKEAQELRERLARLEGHMSAAPTPQQQQQRDELVEKISWCDAELSNIARQANDEALAKDKRGEKWTKEDEDRYNGKAIALQNMKAELITQKVLRDSGVGRQDPDAVKRQHLETTYPDLMKDPKRREIMRLNYLKAVANGSDDGPELVARVARETRRELGLKEPDIDTPVGKRSSYSGVGATGGRGSGAAPNRAYLTREEAAIAEARYPDLPEKEAHKKWLKKIGRVQSRA